MSLVADKVFTRWAKIVDPPHLEWTWRMIRSFYEEPHRAYHTLNHVAACLDLARAHTAGISSVFAATMDLAIFFHDIVYLPGDDRNEVLSANLLRSLGAVLPWSHVTVNHAAEAILATRDHKTDTDDIVVQTVVDLDLAILGSGAAEYDRYVRAIRTEFATVREDAWRAGRAQFLEKMLGRDRIYSTVWGHDRFEKAARANMAREVAFLKGHAMAGLILLSESFETAVLGGWGWPAASKSASVPQETGSQPAAYVDHGVCRVCSGKVVARTRTSSVVILGSPPQMPYVHHWECESCGLVYGRCPKENV
jgi:predicted metal-dependent HD superfamily phosphohydrolase